MKKLPSLLMAAAALGALFAAPKATTAAPITYDFTGAISGDQALGGSHVYTAAGGPNLTAISGSYSQSGTGSPVTGDAFTSGGQLVGNNRGADEMGVGVCFGNGCNNGHIDDNPEIDASGREAVRLDIEPPLGFRLVHHQCELGYQRRAVGHLRRQRGGHRARPQARRRHQRGRQRHDHADRQLPLLRRRQRHDRRRGRAPTLAHPHAECRA